jgi:methylated-DNA-[protein]-cysteine S-methyltransferase
MHFDYCESPLGPLLLVADDDGLVHVDLPHEKRPTSPQPDWCRNARRLAEARHQFEAYFAGELHDFTLKLAPRGTPFQLAVWGALCTIPYAHTTSYGELARRIERPRAVRAVGAANGANPLAIVVPCHRVIGSDGSLTGYGGGLPAKRWLLAHERRHAPTEPLVLM